ncbi:flagellar motor switch protein [Enterococcus mundtii]|uniref:flagellar motor switch protein n=1 Tax=Enterococcus TaxID=1350 RepID=UPI00044804FA|nr:MULTISPECIES: flagellar motor switch protein [Enterococcus]EYT96027.1 flagellar motor switch protein [Enterococcus mundtii CRL35]MDA9428745.1 hypothetical protein [Enterococcus mundtii 1A]MDK4211483.1 flagellar motor switch protein [Enterococcus mundtii]MDO7878801.1 flagellar motor switch protein [Enterococcus mundtii]MEC3941673.1 flagellar motor switch protein [Enterococcus mundtii]
METEIEKKQRIERKRAKMRRVCQMLDIENWEKNERIVTEIRSIIQTDRPVKGREVGNRKKKKGNAKYLRQNPFDS